MLARITTVYAVIAVVPNVITGSTAEEQSGDETQVGRLPGTYRSVLLAVSRARKNVDIKIDALSSAPMASAFSVVEPIRLTYAT